MRKFITLIALMMAMIAHAQSTKILGKNHAMQRVAVAAKYLMLPVQEREENANIRVLVDNEQVQTLANALNDLSGRLAQAANIIKNSKE